MSLADTEEYKQFRANVSRQVVSVKGVNWVYYDIGPKDVPALLLIPGTSGTAEMYFYQCLSLGSRGYRVISVSPGAYWTYESWVQGLHDFMAQKKLGPVHLFGASLGGYLALHYAAVHPQNVRSLLLSNAFCDTQPFEQGTMFVTSLGYMPEFYVKKWVLESFPARSVNPAAVDFMVSTFETLSRDVVASRLTLNCLQGQLGPVDVQESKMVFIDSYDDVVLPSAMRLRLYERFPNVKQALLKQGGDFPVLSMPDEVILHIMVHLRGCGLSPSANPLQEAAEKKRAQEQKQQESVQKQTEQDTNSLFFVPSTVKRQQQLRSIEAKISTKTEHPL